MSFLFCVKSRHARCTIRSHMPRPPFPCVRNERNFTTSSAISAMTSAMLYCILNLPIIGGVADWQIFLKTFVFGFLLLASRQICDIALGMTGKVITMLEIPSVLEVTIPDESMFTIGSGAEWLIVIIVGFVLMFQIIKLLFEIGDRKSTRLNSSH